MKALPSRSVVYLEQTGLDFWKETVLLSFSNATLSAARLDSSQHLQNQKQNNLDGTNRKKCIYDLRVKSVPLKPKQPTERCKNALEQWEPILHQIHCHFKNHDEFSCLRTVFYINLYCEYKYRYRFFLAF